MRTDVEQTLTLSQVSNLLARIASAVIKEAGIYYCTISGIKTAIIAD